MPSSGWTAVYLPIQLLNGYVLAASEFWQLGIKLLETSRCRFFVCVCAQKFSASWGECQGGHVPHRPVGIRSAVSEAPGLSSGAAELSRRSGGGE